MAGPRTRHDVTTQLERNLHLAPAADHELLESGGMPRGALLEEAGKSGALLGNYIIDKGLAYGFESLAAEGSFRRFIQADKMSLDIESKDQLLGVLEQLMILVLEFGFALEARLQLMCLLLHLVVERSNPDQSPQ